MNATPCTCMEHELLMQELRVRIAETLPCQVEDVGVVVGDNLVLWATSKDPPGAAQRRVAWDVRRLVGKTCLVRFLGA